MSILTAHLLGNEDTCASCLHHPTCTAAGQEVNWCKLYTPHELPAHMHLESDTLLELDTDLATLETWEKESLPSPDTVDPLTKSGRHGKLK